nr:guanylate kinase [Coriobacterium glomerans]
MISGPSGAGKGTLVAHARALLPRLGLTVSATTRAPREGEVDGKTYYFLSREKFTALIDGGEFVEWAEVHGNFYGTLRSEIDRCLGLGVSLIMELDPQGAFQVRQQFPEAVLIFIMPPSLGVIRRRLVSRGSETASTLERRLVDAERELQLVGRYDAVVINDDLDRACEELVRIIKRNERI